MFKVTEEMLVFGKQPQTLLSKYNVSAAKVANMIHEGAAEIVKLKKGLSNPAAHHDKQDKKSTCEVDPIAKTAVPLN
jgi:hypothetical protein